MIAEDPVLSMRRQCELLRVSRSNLYYTPRPDSPEELALMRSLDEAHLIHPIYGSRKLVLMLKASGYAVNRKHVQRLMRIMGLECLVPKPNLSKPNKKHPIYPYLLRGMRIVEPNQVWATDITYIPMKAGFVYLVAIIDWFSRRVLSWRISNTMDAIFCLDALAEALDLFSHPKIFNTDQGAQFTSEDFTGMLRQNKIAISMDGKGRCLDNVFVERVWRSLKYEEVYLHAYSDAAEARKQIGAYFDFYNLKRPHQSLGYQTPDAFYRGDLLRKAA
jgi:putative transposase